MAQAKQTRSTSKKGKAGKASGSKKKNVTTGKTSGRMSARKPPKKAPAKKKAPTRSPRTRKYTTRSRYQTFKIGDHVRFDQIQNWESDSVMEDVVGTIVDKIDDDELGLKFIEVQFDLSAEHQSTTGAIVIRRFIVK